MRKIIYFSLIIYFLLEISFVLAQGLVFPSSSLPPIINCGDFFSCLGFFFEKILQIIIALALILATIFIAWAGILYIFKGSGGGKGEEIHKRIFWASVGLVVALLSFVFVQILESFLRQPEEKIFLPFKIVFAQISEISSPTILDCGGISLPSALEDTSVGGNVWQTCLFFYLSRILSLLYIGSLILGVIFLALAGILYITQPEKTKDIHSRLIWGIVGVVVAILSFTIVKIIDIFFISFSR